MAFNSTKTGAEIDSAITKIHKLIDDNDNANAVVAHRVDSIENLLITANAPDGEIAVANNFDGIVKYEGGVPSVYPRSSNYHTLVLRGIGVIGATGVKAGALFSVQNITENPAWEMKDGSIDDKWYFKLPKVNGELPMYVEALVSGYGQDTNLGFYTQIHIGADNGISFGTQFLSRKLTTGRGEMSFSFIINATNTALFDDKWIRIAMKSDSPSGVDFDGIMIFRAFYP